MTKSMLELASRPKFRVLLIRGPWRSDNIRSFSCTRALPAKAQAKSKLPSTPARTRFAPSPTGQLHLGSLRTALFNYLLARKTGGQFLLRLEDTDSKRTVPGAEAALYADLRWAGLQWDEGPEVGGQYGPYRQSERTSIYRKHATDLLKTEHAYRCFCSAERLDGLARRRRALGMPTDYDRTCAHLSEGESDERAAAGEAHVVRLRAPDFYPAFTDLVYGRIGGADTKGVTMKHGEIAYEDPILLKSDATPTYHLANVIDDHLMKITHVVRATEWLPSTPKHLALYSAFGWEAPAYMHVGLLVDGEGRKLSKRTMSTGVGAIRDEMHILAPSLVNFAALLGWSHEKRSDVMQLDELVDAFQAKFTRGNVTVALEKLWFLQKAHASLTVDEALRGDGQAQKTLDEILDALIKNVEAEFPDSHQLSQSYSRSIPLKEYLKSIVTHDARNYHEPKSFISRNKWFFKPTSDEPIHFDSHSVLDLASSQDIFFCRQLSILAHNKFERISGPQWTHDELESLMKSITQELAEQHAGDSTSTSETTSTGTLEQLLSDAQTRDKDGDSTELPSFKVRQKTYYRILCKYMRLALLNGSNGPGLGWTMQILGRDICLERLGQFHLRFNEHLAKAKELLPAPKA